MDFKKFAESIGASFKDEDLLKQAFTHRSYVNENRGTSVAHNERLEFLGDAVLELIVTEYLFEKYPKSPEGEMTSYRSALVNADTLAKLASQLKINDYLLLSRGEAKDMGRARQYILANTFEAFVGALYIDGGYKSAEKFIKTFLLPMTDEIVKSGNWMDAKSFFQEKAQEEDGITPSYKLIKEEGPDHDKKFTIGVYVGEKLFGTGVGKSKQDGEQEAAKVALRTRGWVNGQKD